ncbi:MAG TPA: hypothetical protein VFM30_05980 [Steroidobacteraceae bacterium]|jgi:hypothetical protein|nr:hypothetical protein [Steroidobacteraceae bacterium]
MKEAPRKTVEKARVVTLDNPPPLNPSRNVLVAVVVCVALAAAIYYAFTVG